MRQLLRASLRSGKVRTRLEDSRRRTHGLRNANGRAGGANRACRAHQLDSRRRVTASLARPRARSAAVPDSGMARNELSTLKYSAVAVCANVSITSKLDLWICGFGVAGRDSVRPKPPPETGSNLARARASAMDRRGYGRSGWYRRGGHSLPHRPFALNRHRNHARLFKRSQSCRGE